MKKRFYTSQEMAIWWVCDRKHLGKEIVICATRKIARMICKDLNDKGYAIMPAITKFDLSNPDGVPGADKDTVIKVD